MRERGAVLLTGATGLLGRYLLRDLLLKGRQVAVLARDTRQGCATERIGDIVGFWSESLGLQLPTPVVLNGDFSRNFLGLTPADRNWIGRHCGAVIHSAANLSFRETPEGEPWRTNVEGTKSLLALCRDVGLSEWHQVSTAFVCGKRIGFISEQDLNKGQSFHNSYEDSKFQAEQLVRQAPSIRATIYRPAVIVGDSRTGHTSNYNGLYRFLEVGVRLASLNSTANGAHLPLRLPLSGDEDWNLVSVDWVSRAVVELLAKPEWHGRTFHLVSRSPIPTRLVRDVGAEVLNIPGVEFAGAQGVENPSRLEQMFLDGIQEYWPYLAGTPEFTCENTKSALPDLPPQPVDRPMLGRLIRFAVANNWGRAARQTDGLRPRPFCPFDCADYIEKVFPRQARRSRLARDAGLDLTVSIDLQGEGGGQWSCQWRHGEFISAKKGLAGGAKVIYQTDTATFHSVVSGMQTPQDAFFEQRIAITGDLEIGLKLAVLFGQFLSENPVAKRHHMEVTNFTPC